MRPEFSTPPYQRSRGTIVQRFWRHVYVTETCWEWLAYRSRLGYGRMWVSVRGQRISLSVHRISWEIHHGEIPEGLIVRHKCDNPPCVRPDHLELGTPADNVADAIERGHHPASKSLTAAQILEAGRRYHAGGIRQIDLAREYGVDRATISRVVRGVTRGVFPRTSL